MYSMERSEDLAWVVPAEGSNIWVDCMCIPKGAKHKEAAETFINFLCRPDIARKNMDYIWYSSPIQQVVDGLSEEEAADTALNPTQDIIDRCEVFLDVSEYNELYEENWMNIQTAR